MASVLFRILIWFSICSIPQKEVPKKQHIIFCACIFQYGPNQCMFTRFMNNKGKFLIYTGGEVHIMRFSKKLINFYFWLHQVFVAAHEWGLFQLRRAGATLHRGARASHCGGFSCCRARALGAGFSSCGAWAQQLWLTGSRAQVQQLWHTGLVAPWHVGSSWTRAETHVPCIGRWILDHCTTREVPNIMRLKECFFPPVFVKILFVRHCAYFYIPFSQRVGFQFFENIADDIQLT